MATEADSTDEALAGNLRRWWFASVQEISDIGLQRRTWLDRENTNPHWSYIEFVCSFPADDQLEGVRAKGWLAEHEFRILNDLAHTLTAYGAPRGNNYDQAAILDDPAWLVVVGEALRARQALLVTITDPNERQMLLGVE